MAEAPKASGASPKPDPSLPDPKAGGTPQPADAGKDTGKEPSLLERVQMKAPSVDEEFMKHHDAPDEYWEAVAAGQEPPPPYNGPNYETDLHFTPGGWQQTPKGVAPEDVGKDAISR